MDHYPFIKRPNATIRDSLSVFFPGRPRQRFGEGRVDAFTLIEFIIIIAIIGLLAGIAAPIYADFRYKAQVETAKGIIRGIEGGINAYYYRYGTYPATLGDAMIAVPLDPWGNPYQYVSSTDSNWPSLQRLDRNMRPLNHDFDLYSKGMDGDSAPALTNPVSRDDVVRAGNGAFVDLASAY
jgi:general secretion pathway protein G